MRTVVANLMSEKITVSEGGQRKIISCLEAIIRQQRNKAMSGDLKSANLVFKLMDYMEDAEKELPETSEEKIRDKAIMSSFITQMQQGREFPMDGENLGQVVLKGVRNDKPINVID